MCEAYTNEKKAPTSGAFVELSLLDDLVGNIPLYAKSIILDFAVVKFIFQRQMREVGREFVVMPGKEPVCTERKLFTSVLL